MKKLKNLLFRIKFLVDGKATWTITDGSEHKTKEKWSLRWAIAGIHSSNWKWVRKYGKMKCGCTKNPVTGKIVLHNTTCPVVRNRIGWDEIEGD